MVMTFVLFVVGFVFLIKGADVLVEGSSSIAKKYKISNIVIGLTIVAFGTSAPELIISSLAAIKGQSDISLGNIIGSNISNTLLILGIVAMITPLLIKKNTINREIPFSLLSVVAVFILINDFFIDNALVSSLSRGDGLILILFFIIFIYYTFIISKSDRNALSSFSGEKIEVYSNLTATGMIIVGLVGLFFGGRWIVDGAIEFAKIFGLSEAFIGLTIVAIGTSLPELAASVVAAKKGKADMAIGNVIGSNIFNFLWVLGFSSMLNPISYDIALNADMLILINITIILLILIYVGKKNILSKHEGVFLIILYIAYMSYLIYRR